MLIRKALLTLTFLAFAAFSFGQNLPDSISKQYLVNNYQFIKWSFLNLVEPEPSFQLGYSRPFYGGKIQVMCELGYLFSPSIFWKETNGSWDDDIKESGFRIRLNARKYFLPWNGKLNNKKNYWATDLMYKYAQIWEQGVYVSRYGGEYQEIMNVGTQKSVFAFHVIYGTEKFFVYQSKMMFDYFFGIGYKFKYVTDIDLPDDVINSTSPFWWYDEFGAFNTISIMAGIKLGFGF